jgi:bleomycin hydrolase
VHDPRNEYGKLLSVDRLGNVQGGAPVLYLNCDIATMKKHTVATLQGGKPVWFGCDVGKFFSRKAHVMDTNLFDYGLVFGSKMSMSKADRLNYGESMMTHAMVFTGCDVSGNAVKKLRVENSWGPAYGGSVAKGYASMSSDWFDEYVYQVVLDKNDLPSSITDMLKLKPIVLPAYDPLGALA